MDKLDPMAGRTDDADLTAWALAAGRGDRTALAAFVRGTQRDVHRFVAHLGSPAEADDLAQETYLRALAALPRFGGRSSARTWLLAIARHTVLDAARRASRRPQTTSVDDWDTLAATASSSDPPPSVVDDAQRLRGLVAALADDRREAFVLTQLLDLSYAEAADVCGCPVGTIRSRVARARQDLVVAMDGRSAGPRRRAGGD